MCVLLFQLRCALGNGGGGGGGRAGGMLSQDLPDQRGGQQSCEGGHQQHEQDASNYGSDQLLPLPLFGPSWSQWGLCLDRQ